MNWVSDAAAAINITASRMDADTQDIANGLSACLTRDGQGKPSAAIDWNGQNLSNVAALTTTGAITAGGTANAANFYVGSTTVSSGTIGVGAGSGATMVAWGSASAGLGRMEFYHVGLKSLELQPVASSVNYWRLSGSATGNSVSVEALGTDSNIGIAYYAKGTSGHAFYGQTATPQFTISSTAGSTRYLSVTGSAAGNPTLSASAGSIAVGSDVQGTTATFASQPGFLAYRGSNVTSVSGTIIFDTEQYDTANSYNNATGVFTVPAGQGGMYLATASCVASHTGTPGYFSIEITPSTGQSWYGQTADSLAAGNRDSATVSAVLNLAAGATVSVFARTTGGGADLVFQPLGAGAQRGCWFSMTKVS